MPDKVSRLEAVFVVHQYSVQAPVYFPPGSGEVRSDLYRRGPGCLTQKGIEACYKVAKTWSLWYPDHINGLDHRTVFVRSSEAVHCHETAQALLAGLFSSGEQFNPVPVYGPPPGLDKYVSVAGYVKDVNAEIMKKKQEPIRLPGRTQHRTFGQMINFTKSVFGNPAAEDHEAFFYLKGAIANTYEGLPVPKGWTDNAELLKATFDKYYQHLCEEFMPYFGGHLLRGLASRMRQVYSNELPFGNVWCDYSYHDISLSAILHALEAKVEQPVPDFLAAIFFELRRWSDESPFVDVWYSSGLKPDMSYSDREPLRMQWCGNLHRVPFCKLHDRMYDNVYMKELTDPSKYVEDDAIA